MKNIKKNQIIIYVIALMLVVAGYLNYTSNSNLQSTIKTSSTEEELLETSNIGDAQLVSSNINNQDNDIIEEDKENKYEENSLETSNNSTKSNSEYYSKSKLERDTMYSQIIETYENILSNNNSSEAQKQIAQEEILKINNIRNSIMISENLIKTKGIDNVVIFVNNISVSVIVDKELDKENVSQIQNIISREMSVDTENIHISNK